MLRLTPRNHDGQYVARWRIDVSADCRLDQHEDAFGNITHAFTAEGPFSELARAWSRARSRPATPKASCAARSSGFRQACILRETALTTPDAGDRRLRRRDAATPPAATRSTLLHHMLERLHDDMAYDTDPTQAATTAAEAFALKRGVCQDLTHIFIAAARSLGIPARYVGGYFHRDDGVDRAGGRPRLGRSLRARARLGRLRCRQRHLRHRRPCAGRGRARLSRRRAGARHPLRRRRRGAGGQGPRRPGDASRRRIEAALPIRHAASVYPLQGPRPVRRGCRTS